MSAKAPSYESLLNIAAVAAIPDKATRGRVTQLQKELAKVLREKSELIADLKENSRRARARNLQNPAFVANEQWSGFFLGLNRCLGKIAKYPRIYECPPERLEKIRAKLTSLSEFVEKFAEPSDGGLGITTNSPAQIPDEPRPEPAKEGVE